MPRKHFRHMAQRGMLRVPYPFFAHHGNYLPECMLNDLLLVAEVIVQIALADPASLGNSIGRDRGCAVLVEKFYRGRDDPLLRLVTRHKDHAQATCMDVEYSVGR